MFVFFLVAIPLTSAAEYWADFISLTEKKPLGEAYRICLCSPRPPLVRLVWSWQSGRHYVGYAGEPFTQ